MALRIYAKKKHRVKNVLILTNIFPGCYLKSLDILNDGEVILKINEP